MKKAMLVLSFAALLPLASFAHTKAIGGEPDGIKAIGGEPDILLVVNVLTSLVL